MKLLTRGRGRNVENRYRAARLTQDVESEVERRRGRESRRDGMRGRWRGGAAIMTELKNRGEIVAGRCQVEGGIIPMYRYRGDEEKRREESKRGKCYVIDAEKRGITTRGSRSRKAEKHKNGRSAP